MEERKGENICWLDKENEVISFHEESGWERKKFNSKTDMMDFCCVLISMGYKVQ